MLEWVALGAAGVWWYRRRGKERAGGAEPQAPAEAAPPTYKNGGPGEYAQPQPQPPVYDGGHHNYGAAPKTYGGNQNDGGYVLAPGPPRKNP